jgi:cytoskeleton protein RodZ
MKSIGDRLRQERLRRGLDLDQIAERTKINPAFLEAIEAGDTSRLPGSFFVKSFVRQYAQALELGESVFDAELQQLAAAEPPPPEPKGPALDFTPIAGSLRSPSDHPIGAWLALVLIIAACSGIYVFWQKTHEAAPEPAARQRQVVAPQPQAAQPPAPQSALPAAGVAPSAEPAVSPPAAVPPIAAQQIPEPAPAAPAPPPGAAIRVEVRSTSPAWIRVSADGKYVFTGTLQPGQPQAFGAAVALNIRTGNAGALQITYNGNAVPSLGPQGQVRTVEFTPAEFKVLAPAPKPPDPAGEPSPPPAAL